MKEIREYLCMLGCEVSVQVTKTYLGLRDYFNWKRWDKHFRTPQCDLHFFRESLALEMRFQ